MFWPLLFVDAILLSHAYFSWIYFAFKNVKQISKKTETKNNNITNSQDKTNISFGRGMFGHSGQEVGPLISEPHSVEVPQGRGVGHCPRHDVLVCEDLTAG